MSSAGGIGVRGGRERLVGERGGELLTAILAAVVRLVQAARITRLLAVICLAATLVTWADPGRLLLTGSLGLLALSVGLLHHAAGRFLFTASGLVLLVLYNWAGSEAVPLEVLLQSNRIWAAAGGVTLSADLSGGAPAATSLPPAGRVGLAVSSAYRADTSQFAGTARALADKLSRALNANLASGVDNLRITDPEGRELAGPLALREPDESGAAPEVQNADLDVVGAYRLFGDPGWRDVRAAFDLRNGGPPVTLLLRLDEHLDGVAVRAWAERRELSIHRVRGGDLETQLAGGYLTLQKPAWAGLQALLREVLRAWLVGMTLLAVGVLVAPAARLLPGLADWRAPRGTGLIVALLLGCAGLLTTAWIALDVLEGIPHVQDSVAYLFQARTFALGRLAAPLPAVPEAFQQEFILMRDGAWFSKYPPGHALILTIGVLVGFPWIVSPLSAACTLILVYGLGRFLYGGGTGLLAALLLLCSPFFLFMSGSMMAHPTGLLLATLGILCAARATESESTWVPLLAGISLGWLTASRQLTGLAIFAAVAAWLVARRLQTGGSLAPLLLLGLGWSWPVLGLLAYNRALTGDPWLNPFQLWWDFDRPGFGPGIGLHGGHDLAGGLSNTYANLSALQMELFGWPTYLTLAFALLPFATGRARPGDWLCAAVSVALIAAYVTYWADGLMYGPRYFYEASSCLALLTARGVLCAAEATSGTVRSISRRRLPPYTAPLFIALVAVLVSGNLVANLPGQVASHRGYNFVSGERQALVANAGIHDALVFVPTGDWFAWWEYGSVFSANDPLLQADVIFARDLGPGINRRTMAAFSQRSAYLLSDGRLSPVR